MTTAIKARISRLRSSSRCEISVPSARFSFLGSSAMVVREHYFHGGRLVRFGGFRGWRAAPGVAGPFAGMTPGTCPSWPADHRRRRAARRGPARPPQARCRSLRSRSVPPDAFRSPPLRGWGLRHAASGAAVVLSAAAEASLAAALACASVPVPVRCPVRRGPTSGATLRGTGFTALMELTSCSSCSRNCRAMCRARPTQRPTAAPGQAASSGRAPRGRHRK